MIAPGDTAVIDFPGHELHGQRVRIERIEPEFDIAPEGSDEPCIVEMIFYSRPSLHGIWGIGRERIGGTVENARLRQFERDDDGVQGELLL